VSTAAEWIAAAPAVEPMTDQRYLDLWDETRQAVIHDPAYLPDIFHYMFGYIGARAKTPGLDDDGWAAALLEIAALRAKDGIPMNERGERL